MVSVHMHSMLVGVYLDLVSVSTEGRGGLLERDYEERPKRFWYSLVCLEDKSRADNPVVEGGRGCGQLFFEHGFLFLFQCLEEQILRGENFIEVFILACCLGIM